MVTATGREIMHEPHPNAPGVTMHAELSDPNACPECGGELFRVDRRFIDRLLSLFIPVQRFRCTNPRCGYELNVRSRVRKD